MRVDVITLFPEMFRSVTESGVTGRALQRGLFAFESWNPRDFTTNKHRSVDDRPYGGGPGMVMQVEPLRAAIQAAKQADNEPAHVIYLSPQGRTLDQQGVQELAQRKRLLLVAGRYEGVDERLLQQDVDEEWSIGDYVLSGGELAAMVLIDAVARMLPGVLGHEDSAEFDSFMNGLLDYPHYTRPEQIDGVAVPDVLLQGNHAEIERWRHQQSLGRTWLRRPDLLERMELDAEQKRLLEEFILDLGNF
ncbi:MAG: tRNA (guanosine(37)-N1)-methyltransferase TrmD [Gammaproteobacteria bacterium]|nr:tRNA (guanosine(37)-N1)-methyltransferase TrmD [Gammaproteobacteria bacterium]